MKVLAHASFTKAYKKKPIKIRQAFDDRLKIFVKDSHNQLLNNHPLQGKWHGHRSINVSGDFRAIFKQTGDSAIFVDIDTHHSLYGS